MRWLPTIAGAFLLAARALPGASLNPFVGKWSYWLLGTTVYEFKADKTLTVTMYDTDGQIASVRGWDAHDRRGKYDYDSTAEMLTIW